MGSGTTAVACIKEGRNYLGFELDKNYYEKACERIAIEQAEPSLF
jgi:DNA modification methylase